MNFYLSSYKLGNEVEQLKKLINKTSTKFAYIPNALDFTNADKERLKKHIASDMDDLKAVGASVELLDLKDYFGREDALKAKLDELGGIYISGGNVFILRQAMKLSGLDKLILAMQQRQDFLYMGYSAGCCVLSEKLTQYGMTDDPNDFPYEGLKEQIWEGLGILPFIFEPHYDSDHPESESTWKEIQELINKKELFKAYRDGEVLIIEKN